ncbi:MAG: hypothetical protein WCS17_13600 [Prevotella sp.]
MDLNTPTELKIREVVSDVESLGCDTLLTEAIILLDRAREKVADFVDAQRAKEEIEHEEDMKIFDEIDKLLKSGDKPDMLGKE